MDNYLSWLAIAVSIITAIATGYRSFRKGTKEESNLDAEAAKKYLEIANIVGQKNKELIQLLYDNEQRIHTLEQQVKQLTETVRCYEIGVTELVAQLKAHGAVPTWEPPEE